MSDFSTIKNTMNFKRLFFYLMLNVIVSAGTVLIVLNIWDRINHAETVTPVQVSMLPTAIASAIPPTDAPSPEPTISLRPYEVDEGETLGDIALKFNISVDQLLEVNSFDDPDKLATGMIIFVPISKTIDEVNQTAPISESGSREATAANQPIIPTPENPDIRIVSIVGVDDLATEHIQIRSMSSEALPLEGWRLETNNGLIFTFPNITLFEYGAVDLYTRAGINSVVALYWGRSTPVFQSGAQAVIYDADGNVQAVYSIP